MWCCSCWSGRICGSAADRAHKEAFQQILKGHVYDKTSNLSPCNFTCNHQMIVECVWVFSSWNCSKETHCNSWINGSNLHMDLWIILWITLLPLLCLSWHHMICIICLSPSFWGCGLLIRGQRYFLSNLFCYIFFPPNHAPRLPQGA